MDGRDGQVRRNMKKKLKIKYTMDVTKGVFLGQAILFLNTPNTQDLTTLTL